MRGMTSAERLSDFTSDQLVNIRSLDFARWISAEHQADGFYPSAVKTFVSRWPNSFHAEAFQKSSTYPGTVADASWAGPLAPVAVQPSVRE